MLPDDKICLSVTDEIGHHRDRIQKVAGPYSNVIALFFFELQYMFTQHILNQRSGEFKIQPNEADRIYKWGDRLYNVYYGASLNKYRRFYLLYILVFRILALFRKGPSVCLSFPNKPVWFYLSNYRNKFIIPYKVRVYIPEYDMQLRVLEELITKICGQHGIANAGSIFRIYKSFLDKVYSPVPQKRNQDIMLCGSPAIFFTRMLAAGFLSEGKPVIAEGHGCNQSLTFDETYFNEVEFNYCSDYIDFGKAPQDMRVEKFRYLDPERLEKIRFRFKQSELIEKLYDKGAIKQHTITPQSRILYIPDNLNGVARFGPFHSISNENYLRFKKALFSLGLNIDYKKSPNLSFETCRKQLPFIERERIIEARMEDILLNDIESKYDVIFVDYLGTTYSMAAATKLPVIFFDLQTRNKSPRCTQALENRFYIKKIDTDSAVEQQLSEAIEGFNHSGRTYTNTYTEAYSLNADGKTGLEVLRELIA